MAKYSYIIPFYKVRPYVRPCLDSILAQTCPDWECICVDDGSPDGLGEILDEYARKDSRFRVVHQVNKGVGAARNAAMEVMTGQWFLFVDGDDLSSPWTCELCELALQRYPDVDMLMFGEVCFPQDGEPEWGQGPEGVRIEHRDVRGRVDGFMYSSGHCTRVYRRSLYGDLRNPNLVKGQDRYFLMECVFRTNSIAELNRPISGVRRRIGSSMRSPMNLRKIEAAISSAEHFVSLVNSTDRRVDSSLVRSQINRFVETCMSAIGELSDKRDRIQAFDKWISAVRSIGESKSISGFQMLRMRALALFPHPVVARLLCAVPYKLKSMGLHR